MPRCTVGRGALGRAGSRGVQSIRSDLTGLLQARPGLYGPWSGGSGPGWDDSEPDTSGAPTVRPGSGWSLLAGRKGLGSPAPPRAVRAGGHCGLCGEPQAHSPVSGIQTGCVCTPPCGCAGLAPLRRSCRRRSIRSELSRFWRLRPVRTQRTAGPRPTAAHQA